MYKSRAVIPNVVCYCKGDEDNKMTAISIDQLVKRLEGKRFGELVLHHVNKQPIELIVTEMQERMEWLPAQIRSEIEGLINNVNSLVLKKEFWSDDCGEIAKSITSMVEKELQGKGVPVSEENLFDMFHIIVANYACSTHKDPRIRKLIKRSVGKGPFGRIFGAKSHA
jgi:hypothetical protein